MLAVRCIVFGCIGVRAVVYFFLCANFVLRLFFSDSSVPSVFVPKVLVFSSDEQNDLLRRIGK